MLMALRFEPSRFFLKGKEPFFLNLALLKTLETLANITVKCLSSSLDMPILQLNAFLDDILG